MLYFIIGDDMKKGLIIILIIGIIIIGALIFNYVYVNNYNFKLNGSDYLILNNGDTWKDPLYVVDNNKDIIIDNNIDFNKEGNYEVNYILKIGLFSKKLTRKVDIVNKDKKTSFTLDIKGNNPYYLLINHEYKEDGYDAYDNTDGVLTNNVNVINNISNTEGEYEIIYQVTNSNGITKKSTRKVVVYSFNFEGKLKTKEYAKSNEIILDIKDNNYSYTILPDNTKTQKRLINYEVLENNNYVFNIYDKNNNSLAYEVNIDNIDIEAPTGSCTLSLKDVGGLISVIASDNTEIAGYEYKYGNNKTQLITDKQYNINTMDELASITIYDKAGNTSDITCKTVDNSTIQQRNYTLKSFKVYGSDKKYWFYEPKISKRQKVPLVFYFHGAGGNGNVYSVNNVALPKNIYDGHDFPYYIVAPFNGSEENLVFGLIDELSKKYQIDTNRIFLSGGSAGSPPTIRIANKNPNKFSGVIIISASKNIATYNVDNMASTPVWIFQGTSDNYDIMQQFVSKINNVGGNAKITSYKGGHDAPVNAFLREDLTNWILSTKTK